MEQLWLVIGLAVGAAVAYLVMRVRVVDTQRAADERVADVTSARDELAHQFSALSSAALKDNRQEFLQLAEQHLKQQREVGKTELDGKKREVEQLVKPVEEKLQAVDRVLRQMEKERADAYGGLRNQLRTVAETQQQLQSETSNLVKALRKPEVRGRWGEVQLHRVCEMAGMLPYCDFIEQTSVEGEEGKLLRPDVVVKLPGGKEIVVDAKAPISAYIDAVEAQTDEERELHLDTFARHVREHAQKLSSKSYAQQFESPEFVVMFLPGEVFYSAALERMPDLIERSVEDSVLIATPTTLIALLKAVHYGWRQERMAESAQEVSKLGRELYQRLAGLSQKFATLGSRLQSSVNAYNETVGTLERRVLVSARKFDALGVAEEAGKVAPPDQVEIAVRRLQAAEAASADDDPGELDVLGELESPADAA